MTSLSWRKVNDLVIGFESGAGHQGNVPLSSVFRSEDFADRSLRDPVAAQTGDAWDTLLQRNVSVHGAMASSDFHTPDRSRFEQLSGRVSFLRPGSTCPRRRHLGVLQAIRAGTFVGVHG